MEELAIGIPLQAALALWPDVVVLNQILRTLFADKQRSIMEICKTLGVSRSTLYRYLAEQEQLARDAS